MTDHCSAIKVPVRKESENGPAVLLCSGATWQERHHETIVVWLKDGYVTDRELALRGNWAIVNEKAMCCNCAMETDYIWSLKPTVAILPCDDWQRCYTA